MAVGPQGSSRDNAGVCSGFVQIGSLLEHSVHSLEVLGLVGSSITDHDLGRVLVGHNHSWLRQSASERIRVIRGQGFFQHAGMEVVPNLVGFS